jgi:hypothetical protein
MMRLTVWRKAHGESLQPLTSVGQVQDAGQQVPARRWSFRGAVLAANDPLRALEGLAAHERLVGVVADHSTFVVQAEELPKPAVASDDSAGVGRVRHGAAHGRAVGKIRHFRRYNRRHGQPAGKSRP